MLIVGDCFLMPGDPSFQNWGEGEMWPIWLVATTEFKGSAQQIELEICRKWRTQFVTNSAKTLPSIILELLDKSSDRLQQTLSFPTGWFATHLVNKQKVAKLKISFLPMAFISMGTTLTIWSQLQETAEVCCLYICPWVVHMLSCFQGVKNLTLWSIQIGLHHSIQTIQLPLPHLIGMLWKLFCFEVVGFCGNQWH